MLLLEVRGNLCCSVVELRGCDLDRAKRDDDLQIFCSDVDEIVGAVAGIEVVSQICLGLIHCRQQ